MAKTIGNLAVLISANADKFESVMNGIEKRTVSFTSRLTDIPNKLIGGFGSLGSGFVSSADMVMKTAENLMSFLPGGRLAAVGLGLSGGLSGWGESAQRGLDTMQMLNRESERFGVSPKFFRALEMAAGPDANVVGLALDKMLGTMAKLRSGDKGLTDALTPFIDDMDELKKSNPEQFLLKIAEAASKINSQVERLGFLGNIVGDKAADDVNFMFNPEKIGAAAAKLKELNLYQEQQGDSLRAGNELQRQLKLVQEAVDSRRAMIKAAGDILDLRMQRGEMTTGQRYAYGMELLGDRIAGNGYARQIIKAYADELERAQPKKEPITPEQFAERQRLKALTEGRDALAKYNDTLDKQAKMFGMTAHEAMMYEMQLKGVTDKELEVANARFGRLGARQIVEGFKSPGEKYSEWLNKKDPVWEQLGEETKLKHQEKVFNDMFGMRQRLVDARSFLASASTRPGALERGSAGAAEFMADLNNQAMTGGWQNDLAAIKETMLSLDMKAQEQNRIDADILREMRMDKDVRKVLGIPN